jgi:hypothetical protein
MLIPRLKTGLAALLAQNGFKTVAQAIGAAA